MTKIGCWNIRGLNDSLKQKEVYSFIKMNRLSFFGVIETKVRMDNLDGAASRCFPFGWQYIHNLGSLSTARIIVGWHPQLLSVSLISCSPQLVTVSVEDLVEHKSFFVSIVYGMNQARDRASLWRDMRLLFPQLGTAA